MRLGALFRTKDVDRVTRESEAAGEHALKRTLTSLDMTMLGIGAVIGTGIFAAIGTATAGNADSGLAHHRLRDRGEGDHRPGAPHRRHSDRHEHHGRVSSWPSSPGSW